MALRRQKSKKSQAVDLLEDYLKLQAAKKAAKGATKGARKAAKGTAAYKVAKKTPIVKRIPIIAGVGVAAAVLAAKLRSGGGDESPAAA